MLKKIIAFVLFIAVGVCISTVLQRQPAPASYGKTGSVSSFGLIHSETTGITNSVKIKDREIRIKYAVDSNKSALNSLNRMNVDLYLNNANGRNIIVYGYLHSEVIWTPDSPYMATSEPYQEFTLTGWEMKIPFIDGVWGETDPKDKKNLRYQLRRSDFE